MKDFASRLSSLIILISFLWTSSPIVYALAPPAPSSGEVNEKVSYTITPDQENLVRFGEVTLEIPAGAVKEPVELTIEKLNSVHTLNQGMENVTNGATGYRFSPHPFTFEENIKVTLPYSQKAGDSETELSNLGVWYYNEEQKCWEGLPDYAVDKENRTVTALTNHFTDMITSTLTLPESPSPINFNPTSIKELKAVDPGSVVPQIKGLEPSPFGGGSFSIPFRLTPGRGKATPQLALSYNVNSANSWLGKGFDISIPSITTDTRFGLPDYDGNDDYMLNGEALVLKESAGDVFQYLKRNEGSFEEILHYRESGSDWWKVTDKVGTVSTYGTEDAWSGVDANQVYTWYLKEKRDSNGNFIRYHYTTIDGYTYPESISWSGHGDDEGLYRADFELDNRQDRRIDNRGKFISKLSRRLKSLKFSYNEQGYRTYSFNYEYNLFGQTQLISYSEGDGNGNPLYEYGFEYTSLPEKSGGFEGFGDKTETWGTGTTRPMEKSSSASIGFDLYLGLSIDIWSFYFWGVRRKPLVSFGLSGGYSHTFNWGNSTMADLDGNGLPDLVWQNGSTLQGITNWGKGFSGTKNIENFPGILNKGDQDSFNAGVSASAAGVGGGLTIQHSNSYSKSALSDINGDGFVDVVTKGLSNFSRFEGGNAFQTISWSEGMKQGPVRSISDKERDDYEKAYYVEEPVKRWEAYKPGVINVTHKIYKADGSVSSDDGVRAVVQYPDDGAVIYNVESADPDSEPFTENHRVEAGDFIYMLLDSGSDIKDNDEENNDPYCDDLFWSTDIEYESIEIFHGNSNHQASFYFPGTFSVQPSSVLTPFYSKRVKEEDDEADLWDLSDSAENDLKNLNYESKKAVVLELISMGCFIPVELTFDQFQTLYQSVLPLKKTWLHILYPYDNKTDRFVLQELDNGYESEIITKIKSFLTPLESLFDYNELVKMALPSFDGTLQFWDLDSGGLPKTGYSRYKTMDSVLFNEIPAEPDENDLGKTFGLDNRIYLDRITDETNEKSWDLFLYRNEMGQLSLQEIDSENQTRELDFEMDGSRISYTRDQAEHIYTLISDDYPKKIDSELFDKEILSVVRNEERPVPYLIDTLSSQYYHNLVDPLEQVYLEKKGSYEALLAEYNQILIDLSIAQDALDAALDDEDLKEADLEPYYDAVNLLQGTLDAMETPLDDALTAFETADDAYGLYRDNYEYDSSFDTFHLSDMVSIDDYVSIVLSMAADFTTWENSIYWGFADRDEKDYGFFLQSQEDIDSFLAEQNVFSQDDFLPIDTEMLPEGYDGTYFLLKPFNELNDISEKIDYMDSYRLLVEKFPYYTFDNDLYVANSGMSSDDENFLRTFFNDLNILIPTSLKTEYYYRENALFPQETITLDGESSIIPVNYGDGESISLESGDKCSVFTYLSMDGNRSVLKKVATHIFNSSEDYRAEELNGEFGTYSESEVDDFFSEDYAYNETDQRLPAELEAYRSFDEQKEYLNGGFRNWTYGFWSGYYNWDPSLIGQEEYDFEPVTEDTAVPDPENDKTTPPPYLVAAALNINLEKPEELPVAKEGLDGDPLTVDTWIGSVSNFQDSELVVKGSDVETVYSDYDFAPYMTGDNLWHPMRKGGPVYYKTPVSNSNGGGGSQQLQDIQASYSTSGGVNFSVESINQSLSFGVSRGYKSLMDMNGDRYPDLVTNDNDKAITYITGTGSGFSEQTVLDGAWSHLNSFTNNTASFGISFGGGGSEEVVFASNGLVTASIAKAIPGTGPSFGINGSMTKSNQNMGLQDINGDGLPDHLSRDGSGDLSALLNLGDKFSLTSWDNPMENNLNHSISGSLGGTLSFGASVIGLSAGLSGTVSYTDYQLMDINGDGLADQVKKVDDTDYFEVRFNYGDEFAPQTTKVYCPKWTYSDQDFIDGLTADMETMASSGIGPLETDSSVTESVKINELIDGNQNNEINPFKINDTLNSSAGISLNLGANVKIFLRYLLLTFTIQPGINGSIATTGTSVKMMDMNGDGAPEHLFKAPGDSALHLRVNQMDTVGLLEKINLPQGGSYTLGFDRTDNSVPDPHSRWILKSLKRSDGYENDPGSLGEHSYTQSFSYQSGKYDREEREFLGFKYVTTTNDQDQSRLVNEYLNQKYEAKGKINRTSFTDSQNNILRETLYDYGSRTLSGNGSIFYYLLRETSRTYDEKTSDFMETVKEYGYDPNGNIKTLRSSVTGADDTQNYYLKIDYSDNLPGHIVGLPVSLHTWTGLSENSSRLLRKREAEYDNKGNLTALDQFYSSDESIRTELEYDKYGNILKVTDPVGYTMEYIYDGVQNQYVQQICNYNEHGGPVYDSFMEWDYTLGLDTASVEINENRQEKTYDDFGRLVEIRTSYDTGTTPAVSYKYYTDSFPWRALSSNKVSFDPSDHETIDTLVTIDGLGRISQTAKESEITREDGTKQRGWSKSGRVVYDWKGRSIQEGQTKFEECDYVLPLSEEDFPSVTALDPELSTEKYYDIQDRIVRVVLPDESEIITSYPIGEFSLEGHGLESSGGEVHMGTTQTDPLGIVTETWKNGRGMITAIVKRDNSGNVLTEASYHYNLLGELLESSDYEGNKVHFTYDLMGRQVTIESPDTGRQEFLYNEAGLLWRKNNSNLRSSGLWIEYEYDEFNRMSRILYPESEDVFYNYGSDVSKNNVGRLASVSNESGTTTYEYGEMGEVTSIERTIDRLTPNSADETARMSYVSDYLGRMESITYPDGEILTYSYDRGGQIVGAVGEKNGTEFPYINDIGYDEYGQRVYIEYGNGTETKYSYDEKRRWLTSIKTGLKNSMIDYQNMSYEFDLAGNIEMTENDTYNHTTRQEYSYDSLYQLTGAEGFYDYHKNSGITTLNSHYTQDFSYDKIGNMLSKISNETTSPSVGVSPLDYNSLYSYYSDAPHRVERIGDMYYRYDLNGNTVEERLGGHREISESDPADYTFREGVTIADKAFAWQRDEGGSDDNVYSRQYIWDEENRLKGTTDPSHWTQYRYDHEGERTVKYSDLGETMYFNSMWSVADRRSSKGLRQSKNIYVGETRIATKLNFKDSFDTGYESLNTYYYHSDHLGSSSVITDPDGKVYEHLEYTPYGEMWVEDQTVEDLDKIPYRFTGKEWDEETKLYYMSARYQNPMTSRWMSVDPSGAQLSNPMDRDGNLRSNFNLVESVDWYSYSGNNPVMYRDPSGNIIIPTSHNYVQQNYNDVMGDGPSNIHDAGCYLTANSRVINVLNNIVRRRDPQFARSPSVSPDMLAYQDKYFDGDLLSVGTSGQMINDRTILDTKTERFKGNDILQQFEKYDGSSTDHAAIVGKIKYKDAKGKTKFHFLNVMGIHTNDDGQVIVEVNDTSNRNRQEIKLEDFVSIDVTTLED